MFEVGDIIAKPQGIYYLVLQNKVAINDTVRGYQVLPLSIDHVWSPHFIPYVDHNSSLEFALISSIFRNCEK